MRRCLGLGWDHYWLSLELEIEFFLPVNSPLEGLEKSGRQNVQYRL